MERSVHADGHSRRDKTLGPETLHNIAVVSLRALSEACFKCFPIVIRRGHGHELLHRRRVKTVSTATSGKLLRDGFQWSAYGLF